MTPTFLETADRVAVIGTPGGSRIITMVLLGALAFHQGEDANTIVNLPRYHHQYLPDTVLYEPQAVAQDVVAELESMGHALKEENNTWGNMHVVVWDKQKRQIDAAADSRGVGQAVIIP
jgi:gamma-glutamyltranspeptidase/glutathione hydrolase